MMKIKQPTLFDIKEKLGKPVSKEQRQAWIDEIRARLKRLDEERECRIERK
jgi:hypothetical protein